MFCKRNTLEDNHNCMWTTIFLILVVLWRPDFELNFPSLLLYMILVGALGPPLRK